MAPYTQPCGCLNNCDNCDAKCHAGVLLRWSGNYDFSGNPRIDSFPGYHKRLDEWQDDPTGLVWRIRWDGTSLQTIDNYYQIIDEDLVFPLSPSNALSVATKFVDGQQSAGPGWYLEHILGGQTYLEYAASQIITGPVRDGRMYGYPETISAQVNLPVPGNFHPFPGTLWSDDGGFPVVHLLQEYDQPWVLEIGCVRCTAGVPTITWPDWRPKYGLKSTYFEIEIVQAVKGGPGVNEVQTVTMVRENIDVTGGAFVLNVTNAGIPIGVPFAPYVVPYNATAAQIQSAAEEFVGAGNVVCAGGPINVAPVTLTFVGALAETNVAISTWADNPDLQGRLTFAYTITTPKGWLTKTAEKRTCQTLTAAENRSVYWGGSLSEPDHASPCRPPAIMWWMDGGHDVYLGYNNRSSSSPLFGRRKTARMFGMLSAELQAERLDSVSLDGVEAIETNGFQASFSTLPGQSDTTLTSWLATGGKKLFAHCYSDMNMLPATDTNVTVGELIQPVLFQVSIPYPYTDTPVLVGVSQLSPRIQIRVSENNPYDARDRSVPLWSEDSDYAIITGPGTGTPVPPDNIGAFAVSLRGFRVYVAENFDDALYDLVFLDVDSNEVERFPFVAAKYVGDSVVIRANIDYTGSGVLYEYASAPSSVYKLSRGFGSVFGFAALSQLISLETLYEGVLP